ncbi:hypothetical protein QBC35DRAFT_501043 [Podospora australis]|uniref:Geranylgeranyl pyrophosphate synthetase n=1 Tax=Podospora australis TaxID=1536484 RepID=A0AAN7AHS8_9PEZI|nr:hypothetical protein QBC35DRAFT_501043 [Podospora australis]
MAWSSSRSHRGASRGSHRGAGKMPWRSRNESTQSPESSSPAPPLGKIIRTLTVDDLETTAEGQSSDLTISQFTTVASYNWLDKKNSAPTILVPGKPPLWTPQAAPTTLQEDSGKYFRDKNAARYPKHPLEPAVTVALDADENISTGVAIVACGSTLGNLLRFVRGQDKPFRMLVQTIHATVFLTRRENSPTELIPGVRGYGHTFPEANTTWEADVKGSGSHQRVVRYHFGGLELLVRFEADGYIKPPSSVLTNTSPELSPQADDDQNPLSDLLSDLGVSGSSPSPSSDDLHVKPAGALVPHSQLFELKTRSILSKGKKDHLAEELPRLWISHIPTFLLAYHTRGLFKAEDILIQDVRDEVKNWEQDHKTELAKFAALLNWLVYDNPKEKFELCFSGGGGKLEVREMLDDAVVEALSDDVKGRWAPVSSGTPPPPPPAESDSEDEDDKRYTWDYDYGFYDDEPQPDFTACSADHCGYCGKCDY